MVLVVDDNPDVSRFSSLILLTQGLQVIEANDSLAALLSAASHSSIHLLVVDVDMPRIRGPLLAQCMAHFQVDLKILYTAGSCTQSMIDGVPVLRKPFEPEELVTAAWAVLESPSDAVFSERERTVL